MTKAEEALASSCDAVGVEQPTPEEWQKAKADALGDMLLAQVAEMEERASQLTGYNVLTPQRAKRSD